MAAGKFNLQMRLLRIISGRNVLKNEMKKEMAPELNTLAASALTLNQINIDRSDEKE